MLPATDVSDLPRVGRWSGLPDRAAHGLRDARRRAALAGVGSLPRAPLTNETWISHIESGRTNPAWGTVARLAATLGVDVSELAARAEELQRSER
ncbi:MAG: helix-turn-helix domain-containing protein [Thermoleophilaceae bacterium]